VEKSRDVRFFHEALQFYDVIVGSFTYRLQRTVLLAIRSKYHC